MKPKYLFFLIVVFLLMRWAVVQNKPIAIPVATSIASNAPMDTAIPTFMPTESTNPLRSLAEILQVSEIRSIELKDDWDGLSPTAPIEAHYSLTAGTADYIGQVNFKVGGYSGEPKTDTENLRIPIQDIKLFINTLAQSSLVEGKYKPLEEWTDDYPDLEIKIMLQTENISFYTSSQGERHTPWAMSYNNKTYIIDSDTPMDALDTLDKYMKKDNLEGLVNQLENSLSLPYLTPTPTSLP